MLYMWSYNSSFREQEYIKVFVPLNLDQQGFEALRPIIV